MAVKCTGEDRVLTAQVSGEVDHHGAREIMGELERNIETSLPRVLELDLGGRDLYGQLGHCRTAAGLPPSGRAGGRGTRAQRPPPGGPCPAAAGLDKLIRF